MSLKIKIQDFQPTAKVSIRKVTELTKAEKELANIIIERGRLDQLRSFIEDEQYYMKYYTGSFLRVTKEYGKVLEVVVGGFDQGVVSQYAVFPNYKAFIDDFWRAMLTLNFMAKEDLFMRAIMGVQVQTVVDIYKSLSQLDMEDVKSLPTEEEIFKYAEKRHAKQL